eukprot:CAMPEP_0113455150 /NCGR_PEP_ID=MMETSP0014_2-20120614/8228_1 /TAXON_ID=2857 /ORGANISM="Nitzschia sp." /LENGTH=477 /DNA_ID=CAMNT_0000346573 /DNA_START=96 /DNA_END=1529 /DNA_ORIENTATION=+ /assembly_acc=CAM_ASM_000159
MSTRMPASIHRRGGNGMLQDKRRFFAHHGRIINGYAGAGNNSSNNLNGMNSGRHSIDSPEQSSSSTSFTTTTTSGSSGTSDDRIEDDHAHLSYAVVRGEVLDLAADLRTFRPGDKLDIPYELTITESMQDFWQSAFHSQDRINTSKPFCRRMGLQDRVIPFPLALFLTSSMTHADAAKLQVGFGRVSYIWPVFSGDTLRRTFTVESVRNTSDGNHSVFHFRCDLVNQRNRLCMRADKRMLFEFPIPPSNVQASSSTSSTSSTYTGGEKDEDPNLHVFRDHMLSRSKVAEELQSHSLAGLRPGQLILHSMNRSLTQTQSQQLASLARLTHERHFDVRRYEPTELLIPGGLVMGIVVSAASRDFHELLHQEMIHCNFVNPLHPGNIVGAMSYVHSVQEAVGDLEIVTVRTLGVKNMDVKRDLAGVDIPLELLMIGQDPIKSRDIQRICKTKCPQLHDKIVVQMDRKILRQSPATNVFLL